MDAVATNFSTGPTLEVPPAPGTELARSMGCICPLEANAGGKGAFGGRVGGWWIDWVCPLHAPHGRAEGAGASAATGGAPGRE